MKKIVFGLSLTLAAVAWLTPAPTEREVEPWRAAEAGSGSSLDLVLIETDSGLRPTAMPALDAATPVVSREPSPTQ